MKINWTIPCSAVECPIHRATGAAKQLEGSSQLAGHVYKYEPEDPALDISPCILWPSRSQYFSYEGLLQNQVQQERHQVLTDGKQLLQLLLVGASLVQ